MLKRLTLLGLAAILVATALGLGANPQTVNPASALGLFGDIVADASGQDAGAVAVAVAEGAVSGFNIVTPRGEVCLSNRIRI